MRTALIFVLLLTLHLRSDGRDKPGRPIPAAELTNDYVHLLKKKRIGLVVNNTSMVKQVHLLDTLLKLGINVRKIFAPEHGFRGEAEAGETVNSSIDQKSGLPIISLYGNHKKPTAADLKGIDIIVFDIQDVGARFYTYISTLHYIMEACAENNKQVIILDRPNPNGFYIDGPILEKKYQSFIGMHPIPVVHGMTIGEYGLMINGECWLKDSVQCALRVIKCAEYTHESLYELPVKPSPNLRDNDAVILYPSLCFFEGTTISVGRGTYAPFKQIGAPELASGGYTYSFTPEPIKGMSNTPPHEGKACYGLDLSSESSVIYEEKKLHLAWLIEFYRNYPDQDKFFIPFFEKLAGTDQLRKQIREGRTEEEIRASWEPGLTTFRSVRSKYLLYK